MLLQVRAKLRPLKLQHNNRMKADKRNKKHDFELVNSINTF